MPCHGILHNPCESKNAILRVLGLPRAKLTPERCSLGQNRVLKILVFLVKNPLLLPYDFSFFGRGIGLKTHSLRETHEVSHANFASYEILLGTA